MCEAELFFWVAMCLNLGSLIFNVRNFRRSNQEWAAKHERYLMLERGECSFCGIAGEPMTKEFLGANLVSVCADSVACMGRVKKLKGLIDGK
jgi:hypothetical protein